MKELKFARAVHHHLFSDGVYEHADSTGETVHNNKQTTQTLRFVSIFIILAAGLLGGLPPFFLKVFRDSDSMTTRLVRSFAAGVMLALGPVHILPEAIEEMTDLGGVKYPLGGTCALAGIMLMILLEHLAHIMMYGNDNPHSHSPRGSSGGSSHSHDPKPSYDLKSSFDPKPSALAVLPPVGVIPAPAVPCPRAAAVAEGAPRHQSDASGYPPDMENCLHSTGGGSAVHGHIHVCVSRGLASDWLTAGTVEAVGSVRLKIVAYLFEMGCVFHSVIIGLSLGVNQTDLKEVRSLLIALAFHQWLEGISLASVVIRGGFSLVKGALMILTYSLTCPVGIAIGMAIAETYDPESIKSRAIQGTFNGLSGGILLYISLVQLVAEDMGRLVPGRDSAIGRMLCFAALCGGAASMCLLAVWA